MSYCLNPYCRSPQNPDAAKFCSHCGFKLLLGDRYRAFRPIGRGGFGRTFLAIDEYKPSRPKCVIKQFFPQNQGTQDPEHAHELFRREAVQLEQLGRHPQIPELLAHFEQAEYQYLVQEFINGRNLLQEIAETGPFSDVQVWHLLNDLLPVLEFIHHHQVIHRDIKPQNIIRRASNQQSVLVDFGAAKSIAGRDLARTGTSIGSPEFVAPEQAMGKATFASDLYSLGVTCIYLLTQVRPADLFDTGEGSWIWRPHLPCPVNTVLGEILDKMLQGPVKRRFQSATEVRQAIQAPEILQALGIEGTGDRRQEIGDSAQEVQTDWQGFAAPVGLADETIAVTQLPASARLKVAKNWICQHTLIGHESWVRSVAIHPIKPLLASGSGDKTIRIWNLESGELLRVIQSHEAWVRAIAISPNGKLLASCSNDKTVKLWQWDTGKLLHILKGHGDWVRSVAFSPDGHLLASSSQDKTIRLWRVDTGELVHTLNGHLHWVITVTFAPLTYPDNADGHLVISGSRDKTIRVWDWHTGKQVTVLEGHQDAVNGVAVSPNGRLIVSASDDSTIRLWDTQPATLQQTLAEQQSAVNAVAISPTGELLVSGGQDKMVQIWSTQTGALLHTLSGHSNWIWSVAVSADSQTIASASWDGSIKLWRQEA